MTSEHPPRPAALRSVQLPVDDVDTSAAFYASLLGLEIRFVDGSAYAVLDGGGCNLALAHGEESLGAHGAAPVFKVADLEAAVRRVVARGGRLLMPPSEGGHEVRALLEDPSGNPIIVYRPVDV